MFLRDSYKYSEKYSVSNNRFVTYEKNKKDFSLGAWVRWQKPTKLYQQINLISYTYDRDTYVHRNIDQDSLYDIDYYTSRGQIERNVYIKFGYEIGDVKPIKKWLSVEYGVSASPYYEFDKYRPLIITSFPRKNYSIGLALGIEGGINIKPIDNFMIGYHINPLIGEVFWKHRRIDNPNLLESQRETNSLETDFELNKAFLAIQNINLIYSFDVKTKRKKKRRKKRR